MRNALSLTLIGPMTLRITTISIMTLSIVAFDIKIKHNTQHYDSVVYVEYLK